jgi:hypothetical protein
MPAERDAAFVGWRLQSEVRAFDGRQHRAKRAGLFEKMMLEGLMTVRKQVGEKNKSQGHDGAPTDGKLSNKDYERHLAKRCSPWRLTPRSADTSVRCPTIAAASRQVCLWSVC